MLKTISFFSLPRRKWVIYLRPASDETVVGISVQVGSSYRRNLEVGKYFQKKLRRCCEE